MFTGNIFSESRPLDARQVRTRNALRAAVLDLIGEKPFVAVTVGEIAEKAGIGYATFFRHYRDKDALLADAAEGLIGEMLLSLAPLALMTETRSAALTLCRSIENRRALYVALLVGGAGNAVREQILARSIRQVDLSQTARVSWLPDSLGPLHMVTAVLTIVCWWLEQGSNRTAEEMSVIIDRLVLAPALAPSD